MIRKCDTCKHCNGVLFLLMTYYLTNLTVQMPGNQVTKQLYNH